jgi:hypothetical protein
MQKKYPKGGPDLHAASKKVDTDRNAGIKNSPGFIKACERVNTPVTTRQASKYAKGRGKAFRGE